MRWKGIITFVVLNILLSVFGLLFADSLIKGAIETIGSRLNKAKVEIDNLDFSLLNLSLDIKGLQVADPDNEWRNQFEVKDIRFKLNLKPLLEKKVVIEEMAIEGIRTGTKRKTSGKLAKRKKTFWTKGAQLIGKEVRALPAMQLLKGKQKINVDELVKPAQLTAPTKLNKINTELNTRHNNSRTALENLNISPRVESLKRRIDSVNLKEKNPIKLQKELKKLRTIKKDLDALTSEINRTKKKIQDDFGFIDNSIKQVEQIKEQNYQVIIKTIADIKGVDEENIARLVFGPVWFDRANTLLGWLDIAGKVMPEKGAAPPKAARATGVNIDFPKEESYPGFLLKKASVTKAGSGGPEDLRFEGKIQDVCSDQALHGKPTTLVLKRAKPAFELNGTFDHRKAIGRDTIKLVMQAVDLKGFDLGKSSLLPKKVAQGTAQIEVTLERKGKEIEMILVVLPVKLVFAEEDIPEGELAQEIANLLATAQDIKIKGRIYGRKGQLKLKIDSNIDKLLVARFKKLVDERLAEAKKQIRQKIDQIVEKPKQALLKDLQSKKGKIDSLLKDKEAAVNQARDTAKAKIKKTEKKIKKRLRDRLKDRFK